MPDAFFSPGALDFKSAVISVNFSPIGFRVAGLC